MDTATKIKKLQLDEPIPLLTHLEELKRRLIFILIVVVLCGFALYPFIDIVLRDIARPVVDCILSAP